MESHFGGIDLGGTKILAAVIDASGKRLATAKRPTPVSGARALEHALAETLGEAISASRIEAGALSAIGVGSPGPLDPERGVVLHTPHLKLRNFPLASILRRRFGVPVFVDNDVHLATFGELYAGAARGRTEAVAIWIGTGIGGCVVQEGKIHRGINRNAGEIGHIYLDVKKAAPGQSKRTLEGLASKSGILEYFLKTSKKWKKSRLHRSVKKAGTLKSSDWKDAVDHGDRLAAEALERSARAVGIAVANLFDILSPEIFILGGGVVDAFGEEYRRRVESTARAYAFTQDLGRVAVRISRLGDNAGVVGAALYAREMAAKS